MYNKLKVVTQEVIVVTVALTLVAVIVDVNARAERLAEHPEVATQGGSGDSLKTHTHTHIQYFGNYRTNGAVQLSTFTQVQYLT